MAKQRIFNIPPSTTPHCNTGVVTAHSGRQYKVIGWNFDQDKAIVANDKGEVKAMTNHQISQL